MTRRAKKLTPLCLRCGNPTRGVYCGECQTLGFGPYLAITEESDNELIKAIEHDGIPQARLAAESGVSRVAINRRYHRAQLRAKRRAELGWPA